MESHLTEQEIELLQILHTMIDKRFNRTNRSKRIDACMLKIRMSIIAIIRETMNIYSPEELGRILKSLVQKGSVQTNMDDKEMEFKPDLAYYVPSSELT